MKYTFLALITIGLALSSTIDKSFILEKFMDSPKDLFKAYHTLFRKEKQYELNTQEGINRYKIFNQNVKQIKELNAKAGKQIYGFTQFLDLTHEEFKAKMLVKPWVLEEAFGRKFNLQGPSRPDFTGVKVGNIDHRGLLGPAKDQGSCGSCWAFAAVATLEAGYKKISGTSELFSEQYLVDCDDNDSGCNGGWPSRTYPWLKNNGIKKDSDRPYFAKKGICSTAERNSALNIIDSHKQCEENCDLKFWTDLLKNGPVLVAMDASSDSLSKYKPSEPNSEEVWVPDVCDKVNHAVTAVGAKEENGKVKLLIRNSWGLDWGVEGHFWVAAENHCYILDFAWQPVMKEHTPFPDTSDSCPLMFDSCEATSVSKRACGGLPDSEALFGEGKTVQKWEQTEDNKYWEFFEEANCVGKPDWNYESQCWADKWWNKETKFRSASNDVEYPGNCVYLYYDTCLAGEKLMVCENVEDVTSTILNLSKVKSMYMRGWIWPTHAIAVVFFEEKNYKGKAYGLPREKYYNLTQNQEALDAMAKAKSIAIVRHG